MKKRMTSIACAALCASTALAAENFSAKQLGRGFTGLTKDFTASLSNPALLTQYDDDDDGYFALNLGGILADEHDVIDKGEDLADDIEAFDDDIERLMTLDPSEIPAFKADLNAQIEQITGTLASIDQKPVQFREGLSALMIIPNRHLSFGLFASQYGRLAGIVDYDESDEQVLKNALDSGDFAPEDLKSHAVGLGYSVVEAGTMLGFQFIESAQYDLSLGSKIKFQRIDLFYNKINVADFDEDEFDLTDDEFLTDSDSMNVDLGLYTAWGKTKQWQSAVVINNLSSHKVTLAPQDIQFTLDTSVQVGLSYQTSWLYLAAEMDLTERESFQELAPVQYVSLGAEFDWSEHMQFRLGARTDLKDNDGDIYTLGLGFSPWDIVSIDIAGFTGDNDAKGLAVEFGLKI